MEFGERSQYSGEDDLCDDQGEPQKPDSLQPLPPPPPDAGVFHENEGPVCSDGSCESQW